MTKVAIVTGANKGIGKSIVKLLCQRFDGVVYLTSRDEGRGKLAVKDLQELGLKPKYHQLDIEDKKSIETLRDYIELNHGGIEILVNNAAISSNFGKAPDSYEDAEQTIRVNFTANLDVCNILFPILNPHARVVNLSSSLGQLLNINGRELRDKFSASTLTESDLIKMLKEYLNDVKKGEYRKWSHLSYSVSKVAISSLTRIQQREITKKRPNDDIAINSVHPGYVITDMTNGRGVLNVDEGAEAPVYCALLPNNTKIKGSYIWWDKSEVEWTALKAPKPGY